MANIIDEPKAYLKDEEFVEKFCKPVLELLAPKAGEKILDLCCGVGVLSAKIAEQGCTVIAVDADEHIVNMARNIGVDARLADAQTLKMGEKFDAVVCSGALHWIADHRAVVRTAWHHLKDGGRFVVECGGEGCGRIIREGIKIALDKRGIDYKTRNPWKFPEIGTMTAILENQGFRVKSIARFDSPTKLGDELADSLKYFANKLTEGFSDAERKEFYDEVSDYCRPLLWSDENGWVADFVKLRFVAVKDCNLGKR